LSVHRGTCDFFALVGGGKDQLGDHADFRTLQSSENPTLDLSRLALMRFKLRTEELFEAAVTVRPLQPFGDSKGVLLVVRSPCAWEGPVPKRRVDFGDHRGIGRHAPTVEGPEMHGP
jgi:hypothetical protein